jgi:carboxyl-terminal processing protease
MITLTISRLIVKVIFCIEALLFITQAQAQTQNTPCGNIESLLYLTQKIHIQPPVFDKEFAKKVIENYLFSIDGQCIHFYEKDLMALKKIQEEELTVQAIFCKSYDFFFTNYTTRMKETDSILNVCLKKKLLWNKLDSLVINEKFTNGYSKNLNQKVKKIEDEIKLSMLSQLSLMDRLKKDFEFEKNDSIKLKVIQKQRKTLNKKMNDIIELKYYLEENLLQSIIELCDPHSNYFTSRQKTKFKESLSTSSEKFGFYFEANKMEHIEIAAIQPGSPAWKCNQLNVGDEVTKIKFLNKPTIDLNDVELDEFNDLISNSTENELEITVLKRSGATVEVNLKKAEVQSLENTVNAYILSGENPIGYISLPSFYTDYAENSPFGCANDVAKEISKLKEENIKGLILDLRNNGGGSVAEATNLAGIFIDSGPLFIEKIKDQKPRVMKDVNRGAIYDGPLVVIINKGSASASELLAQMLKTQHRAIIVGSTSYGKATGQILIPLDTAVNITNLEQEHNTANGYLKITVEKLYDLSGCTYQKNGVMPHIPIPDLWSNFIEGEIKYDNALLADKIEKNVVVNATPDEKIKLCASLSAERIKNDPQFKRIQSVSDTISAFYNYTSVPLYPTSYNHLVESVQMVDSIVDLTFYKSDSLLVIKPTLHNTDLMKMDNFLQSIIQEEMKNLNADIILRETYHILADYNKN